jgi:TolA-binding protein
MMRDYFMRRDYFDARERRYKPLPRTTDAVANQFEALTGQIRDLEDRIEELENPPMDNDAMSAIRDLEARIEQLETR